MKVSVYPKTANYVIGRLQDLIYDYYTDMEKYKHYSILEMFDFIRTIPYEPDPPGDELIMRPSILLKRGRGDCDDKTIMGCSYFKCKDIPTGFSLVSDRPEKPVHHIFTIFQNYGKWYDFDATYPHNVFLENRQWFNRINFLL